MTSISGKTTNGFTYEGDYERPSADRAISCDMSPMVLRSPIASS
ncbi:hypothetical protein [Dyella terrae]|nr:MULTISPECIES: hypothetical protein [Dyella]ULU23386.1 hypothetical protein DYST_00282 [Dyella terrae]